MSNQRQWFSYEMSLSDIEHAIKQYMEDMDLLALSASFQCGGHGRLCDASSHTFICDGIRENGECTRCPADNPVLAGIEYTDHCLFSILHLAKDSDKAAIYLILCELLSNIEHAKDQ